MEKEQKRQSQRAPKPSPSQALSIAAQSSICVRGVCPWLGKENQRRRNVCAENRQETPCLLVRLHSAYRAQDKTGGTRVREEIRSGAWDAVMVYMPKKRNQERRSAKSKDGKPRLFKNPVKEDYRIHGEPRRPPLPVLDPPLPSSILRLDRSPISLI